MKMATAKIPVKALGQSLAKLGSQGQAASSVVGSRQLSTSEVAPAHDVPVDLKSASRLASMRKGSGYRSSFSGQVATVFGAGGCIGRSVCNRLGKHGAQMVIPYRGEHYKLMRLKVCGDLGQVLFTPFHLRDDDSIRKSMKYSNVVINLIGQNHATKNFTLEEANADGPARLARLAREAGVERFIHVSHINAREKPERVFTLQGSEFLRTKWLGEQRVLEEFPDATIIRASDVTAEDDKFLTWYFAVHRYGLWGGVPLWQKGECTMKAPVHFADVGHAVTNAVNDFAAKGQIYEATGPEFYKLSELIDYLYILSGRNRTDWGYKRVDLRLNPQCFVRQFLMEQLPVGVKYFGNPGLDMLERSILSDETEGYPSIEALGVTPAKMTTYMPSLIDAFRVMAYYEPETLADEPFVPLPTPLTRLQQREMLATSRMGPLQALGLEV